MAGLTPAEQAKSICEAAGDNFREVMEAHLLRGYVFSGPDYFLLGRPVARALGGGVLARRDAAPDAWFVWVGVGEAARLLALMPFPLPWLGWYRGGRGWPANHWVRTERFESALATRARA